MKKLTSILCCLMALSLFFSCNNNEMMPEYNPENGAGSLQIESDIDLSSLNTLRSIEVSAANSTTDPDKRELSMQFNSDTWNNDSNKPVLIVSVGNKAYVVPNGNYDYTDNNGSKHVHIAYNVAYASTNDEVKFYLLDKTTQYDVNAQTISFANQNPTTLSPLNDPSKKNKYNFIFTTAATTIQNIMNSGNRLTAPFKPLGTMILFDATVATNTTPQLTLKYNCFDVEATVDMKTGLSKGTGEITKEFTLQRGTADKSIYGIYSVCRSEEYGSIKLSGFKGSSSYRIYSISNFKQYDGKYITLKNEIKDADFFVSEWSGTNTIKVGNIEHYAQPIIAEYREKNTNDWISYDYSGETLEISGLDATKTYELRLFGMSSLTIQNFNSSDFGINPNIKKITQWGTTKWETMQYAFAYCNKMDIDANDKPNLSNCSDCNNMFAGCNSLTGGNNIGKWDVSGVNDMSNMFLGTAINKDLSEWDVSNVTNMSSMFGGASEFDNGGQPLNWGEKTRNVTDMSSMFEGASVFNQPIYTWNVSSVTNMMSMFKKATSFNMDLNDWNVGNVTSVSDMFYEAKAYNNRGQALNWGEKTKNFQNLDQMFYGATSFNIDISNWDVSGCTSMHGTFNGAKAFNNGGQPLNWGEKTKNVRTMSFMFQDAIAFNQDINNWNVSSVRAMQAMFSGAKSFNKPLDHWIVTNVTDMEVMFMDATVFNQNISGWNVANVTNYGMIFDRTAMTNDNKPAKFR